MFLAFFLTLLPVFFDAAPEVPTLVGMDLFATCELPVFVADMILVVTADDPGCTLVYEPYIFEHCQWVYISHGVAVWTCWPYSQLMPSCVKDWVWCLPPSKCYLAFAGGGQIGYRCLCGNFPTKD